MIMSTNKFLSFKKAKAYVRSLNLKSYSSWILFATSIKRPSFITSSPNIIYKNKGWISFNDWLGCEPKICGRKRRYTVNDNFFKEWTCDMAYILGFWFADGSITRTSLNSFRFTICQKENEILYRIAATMQCEPAPIKMYNGCYLFGISSKEIATDLANLGGIERKSLVCNFPAVPEKYLSDFIRGYFDGDGSVYYSKRSGFYMSKFTSGSKNFITTLYENLKTYADIKGGTLEEQRARPNIVIKGRKSKMSNVCYHLHFSSLGYNN